MSPNMDNLAEIRTLGERDGLGGPGGPLHLESDYVARLFREEPSVEGALRGLLEPWSREGNVRAGALFLRRDCGWAKVGFWPADSAGLDRGAVSRLLSREFTAETGPEVAGRREGPLVWYSLGIPEDEVARLALEPGAKWDDVPALPRSVASRLTLFLTDLRGGKPGNTVALRSDFSRRLLLTRDGEEGLEQWRREFPEIIGRSRRMAEVLSLVRRAAPTDVSILITGESGTGKELIGRAIHRMSKRSKGPFVSENCASFSPTLLEAEIFGSEQGAYTGADRLRKGLMERAHGGTVFLDEIGEMGPALQSKLLRVLQEREVRRVGGSETIPTDFRLVSATHRQLDEEVRSGNFREDLLFRIQVISIRLPALRSRKEDIPQLTQHFLAELSRQRGIPEPILHPEADQMLQEYDWPGNIRELRNEIERALTLSPDLITPDSLSRRFEKPLLPSPVARKVREELGANIYSLEREVIGGVIQEVLEETGGNKAMAARILGIPKTNLYRRLQRYGIHRR